MEMYGIHSFTDGWNKATGKELTVLRFSLVFYGKIESPNTPTNCIELQIGSVLRRLHAGAILNDHRAMCNKYVELGKFRDFLPRLILPQSQWLSKIGFDFHSKWTWYRPITLEFLDQKSNFTVQTIAWAKPYVRTLVKFRWYSKLCVGLATRVQNCTNVRWYFTIEWCELNSNAV